jgi:hypothetical protein
MSRRLSTFSWLKCCSNRISRSVRLQSMASSKALAIFLIATVSPVTVSLAAQMSPYAPWPIFFLTS